MDAEEMKRKYIDYTGKLQRFWENRGNKREGNKIF
jgi:hypothetical protein